MENAKENIQRGHPHICMDRLEDGRPRITGLTQLSKLGAKRITGLTQL